MIEGEGGRSRHGPKVGARMRDWLRRNHWWRPLLLVIVIIIGVLVARTIYIPKDFGVHSGFTYGLYRGDNVGEWKSVTVKYQGRGFCATCHQDKFNKIMGTPHKVIQCENCHGPGLGHPDGGVKLWPGDADSLCLRCHNKLAYPPNGRSLIPGIDRNRHPIPNTKCVDCHNPHQPTPLPAGAE
jgi:predicted CXXCH cytochrome family protein